LDYNTNATDYNKPLTSKNMIRKVLYYNMKFLWHYLLHQVQLWLACSC